MERLATVAHLRSERDPLGPSRFSAALLTIFAIVGVVTSTMGFYGVVAFGVTRRTREIGTRMALGADTRRIARLFLRDVWEALLAGLVLGLALAGVLARVIAVRLFGISLHDPSVWSGAVGLVALMSLAVTLPPILRATRMAPWEALRVE